MELHFLKAPKFPHYLRCLTFEFPNNIFSPPKNTYRDSAGTGVLPTEKIGIMASKKLKQLEFFFDFLDQGGRTIIGIHATSYD